MDDVTLPAATIAGEAGVPLAGRQDVVVHGAEPLAEAGPGSFTWTKALSGKKAAALDRLDGVLLVAPPPASDEEAARVRDLSARNALILHEAPRQLFARLLDRFFGHLQLSFPPGIDPLARIDPTARIGQGVSIGAFCFVGPGAVVGDGTVMHPHAVVHAGTVVGRDCVLKSHSVVGNSGFGFVRNDDGSLSAFPQVGRVVLEDEVQVGCGSMVDRPGLGTTRLRRGTKLDNLVHISHGARCGPYAIITACAEVGAGVVVGEGAWLGPNVCSIEGVTFGERSFTGIGATVIKDVAPGATVAGNPAEDTETIRRTRRAIKKLVASEE